MAWSAAVAGIAAGVKGLIYLWQRAGAGGNRVVVWLREKERVREALSMLTTTEGWPNGSRSLPESLAAIYQRQAATDGQLARYIEEHKAHHIDLDAAVNRES